MMLSVQHFKNIHSRLWHHQSERVISSYFLLGKIPKTWNNKTKHIPCGSLTEHHWKLHQRDDWLSFNICSSRGSSSRFIHQSLSIQTREKHKKAQKTRSKQSWRKGPSAVELEEATPWDDVDTDVEGFNFPRKSFQAPKEAKVSKSLSALFEDETSADDDLKELFGGRDFDVPLEMPSKEQYKYERNAHYRDIRHERWRQKQEKKRQANIQGKNDSSEIAVDDFSVPVGAIPGEETRAGALRWGRRHQKEKASARRLQAILNEDHQEEVKRTHRKKKKITKINASEFQPPPVLKVQIPPNPMTVKELGRKCSKKISEILAKAADLGEHGLTEEDLLEPDISELLALEFGFEAERLSNRDVTRISAKEKASKQYPARPPVICVMGHVDHGKTTLLDYLRKANVAENEAGGITQKLAAFSVKGSLESSAKVTFLDTPGHAAFSKMRSSGAQVTDIVCLVIAADDGVSPQTEEVLNLVKKHKLNLVVAISKIDKPGVDLKEAKERIQNQLLERGFSCENYGGDTPVVGVSGITGEGIAELTELLSLQSEVLELQADPKGQPEALVLDAWVDRGLGVVADIVVTWGQLKPGDAIVVGKQSTKIRRIIGADGKNMKKAEPSTPARILGLKGLPAAGDEIIGTESEAEGRRISSLRERQAVIKEMMNAQLQSDPAPPQDADQDSDHLLVEVEPISGPTIVPMIIKADADGVLDAVCKAIEAIGNEEVTPSIIYSAVGAVSKGDIDLAASTGIETPIFCFGVGIEGGPTKQEAKRQGINIYRHKVIYHLIDDVKEKLSEYLPTIRIEETLGSAEVLQMFELSGTSKGKSIAGCRVKEGMLVASEHYRILRGGKEIFSTNTLASLKHHKEKVSEAKKGTECGLLFDDFTNIKPGDQIECFKVEEKAKLLD